MQGRCDSFVVETNVHYPTDINLLLDALRKIILLTARLSKKYRLTDWRQHLHNFRSLKRLMRTVLNKKRGACRSEEKKKQNIKYGDAMFVDMKYKVCENCHENIHKKELGGSCTYCHNTDTWEKKHKKK